MSHKAKHADVRSTSAPRASGARGTLVMSSATVRWGSLGLQLIASARLCDNHVREADRSLWGRNSHEPLALGVAATRPSRGTSVISSPLPRQASSVVLASPMSIKQGADSDSLGDPVSGARQPVGGGRQTWPEQPRRGIVVLALKQLQPPSRGWQYRPTLPCRP